MHLSETSDLSFYPDNYQKKHGSHVSRFEIFHIILAFMVNLQVVELTLGITGRPKCNSNSETNVFPPVMNDVIFNPFYLLVYATDQ